jgi:hypothetical protein
VKTVYLKRSAAAEMRALGRDATVEHGGALVGDPEHHDVLAFVEAPDGTRRSSVVVHLRGADLEEGVTRAIRENPGARLIGFPHVHLGGLDALSSGDHTTLDRLVLDPRLPKAGVLSILIITSKGAEPRLRGWIARAPGVTEEVELVEVDDPKTAREKMKSRMFAPMLPAPVLATDAARERFETELREIEELGYTVEADLVLRGVRVRLAHPARKGALQITIPPEGWARPPKLEIVRASGTVEIIVTSLMAPLLAGWSSAYSLVDLVSFIEPKLIWPKSLGSALKAAAHKASAVVGGAS